MNRTKVCYFQTKAADSQCATSMLSVQFSSKRAEPMLRGASTWWKQLGSPGHLAAETLANPWQASYVREINFFSVKLFRFQASCCTPTSRYFIWITQGYYFYCQSYLTVLIKVEIVPIFLMLKNSKNMNVTNPIPYFIFQKSDFLRSHNFKMLFISY